MKKLSWINFEDNLTSILEGTNFVLDTTTKKIPFATFQACSPISMFKMVQLNSFCIEYDICYNFSGVNFTFWSNQDLIIYAMRERSGTMTGRMSNE